MDQTRVPNRLSCRPFEDTIDGYFPLHVSLRQMLKRNGFAAAIVTMEYAPILHVPGLPHDAPVPLSIHTGFAGMIEKATFCVTHDTLCGVGGWRWWSFEAAGATHLDGMTRLAEPCFVTGRGFPPGLVETPLLGTVASGLDEGLAIVEGPPSNLPETASIWGPFRRSKIICADRVEASHGPSRSTRKLSRNGLYFVE